MQEWSLVLSPTCQRSSLQRLQTLTNVHLRISEKDDIWIPSLLEDLLGAQRVGCQNGGAFSGPYKDTASTGLPRGQQERHQFDNFPFVIQSAHLPPPNLKPRRHPKPPTMKLNPWPQKAGSKSPHPQHVILIPKEAS